MFKVYTNTTDYMLKLSRVVRRETVMTVSAEQLNQAVASELCAQRARVNITIDQLVERTGLSKSTVQSYLKGERASLNPFVNLCFALNTSPSVILDAAENTFASKETVKDG